MTSQTHRDEEQSLTGGTVRCSRRGLLAGLVPMAGAALAIAARGERHEAGEESTPHTGYRVTAHVSRYYEAARY